MLISAKCSNIISQAFQIGHIERFLTVPLFPLFLFALLGLLMSLYTPAAAYAQTTAIKYQGGREISLSTASKKIGVPALRARAATWNVLPANLVQEIKTLPPKQASLRFELFPDTSVVLGDILLKEPKIGQFSIVGKLAAPHSGKGYLIIEGSIMSGVIKMGTKDYRISSNSQGQIEIVEVDCKSYPKEHEPKQREESTSSPSPAVGPKPRLGDSPTHRITTAALTTNPEIDVLVVYTPAVQTALGGTTNVNTNIQLAVTMANEAYSNSKIDQRLNLVHSALVNYTESGSFGTDLDRLQDTNDGHIDKIHALRDRHGADVVVLLVQSGDACGKANLAWISSDADDDSAFAVVAQGCITNHTFAHELGHISGAHHDWEVDKTLLPMYAHGFVSVDGRWRTIMAYDDECEENGVDCPRVEYFANPNLTYSDGRSLGDEDTANNTRRLNETAVTVEGFRIRGPRVSLYEGNGGAQDHVCVVSIATDDAINFTSGPNFRFCDNDEARSVRIFDAPAGRVLRLYDNPDGDTQDDWSEVVIKRQITDKLIGSFQRSFEDADVRVVYHANNGLDGKVSRLEVSSTNSGPLIDLHEGNNATQNLLCSIPAGQPMDYQFPGHPQCDNDEARSLTLYNIPAGVVIRVFDNPNGSREDDWSEIIVKQAISSKVVGSFERSFEDSSLRVIYHRNNGLDGKVSRLEIGSAAVGPIVDLYEGNSASQNLVCSVPVGQNLFINFKNHNECDNDEARSLKLYDVPAGRIFLFYDNPEGNKEDDWTAIVTKRAVKERSVSSFENSFEDNDLRMVYFRNNGLDGKVSRLQTTESSRLKGTLSFYEGNNATQNKVCDLDVRDQTIRFKSHDACDNDEARSVMLTLVKAGTSIQIYDNPDCRTNDDRAYVTVKRDIFRKKIGTFQNTFEDDDVRVTYYRKNGLDGKVSCVKIDAP